MTKKYSFALAFLLLVIAFLLLLVIPENAEADPDPVPHPIHLAWDPNPEPDIAGYRLYSGLITRCYDKYVQVDANTNDVALLHLEPNTTYFFAVTAFNTAGLESLYSDELEITTPELTTPTISFSINKKPDSQNPDTTSTDIEIKGYPYATAEVLGSYDLMNWFVISTENLTSYGQLTIDHQISDTTKRFFYKINQTINAQDVIQIDD